MRRLLLTVWTGMSVRNLMFGSVYPTLADSFNLTIMSSNSDGLAEDLESRQNKVELIRYRNPRWNLPKLRSTIRTFLNTCDRSGLRYDLVGNNRVLTFYLKRVANVGRLRRFMYTYIGKYLYLGRISANWGICRELAYFLPVRFLYPNIDVMLLASLDDPKDQQLAFSSKRLNLPLLVLVHSWDNLDKYHLVVIPDRLLVWNNGMAETAQAVHGVPSDAIRVVGGPQYETYRHIGKTTVKSDFLQRLDIRSDSRILTYTCTSEWAFPDEEEFIDLLLELVEAKEFGESTLVVRLHPTESRSTKYHILYELGNRPIRFDYPDAGFAAQKTSKLGDRQGIIKFVELVQFSDVVINLASTTTLDALCFDTPAICIGFNPVLPSSALNSAEDLHRSAHFNPVLESGAISFSRSQQELCDDISQALHTPQEKSKKRHQLVDTLIPDLPTGKLIRESILEII